MIVRSNDCIFCKIVTKEEPSNIVYEDGLVCCFLDTDPINEGHVLIVPKAHHLDADDLDDETLFRISLLSKKLIKAIKKAYDPDGYTIMQNGGIFNDIQHYHLHVFPRYTQDGFGWTSKTVENEKTFDAVEENLKAILKNFSDEGNKLYIDP